MTLIAGVDSGMAPPKRHGNVWRTVGEQVQAGASTAQALATATSLAAEACGVAGETGRLAAGMAADILVVAGDLSQDVARLGDPCHVVVRGERVSLGRS